MLVGCKRFGHRAANPVKSNENGAGVVQSVFQSVKANRFKNRTQRKIHFQCVTREEYPSLSWAPR